MLADQEEEGKEESSSEEIIEEYSTDLYDGVEADTADTEMNSEIDENENLPAIADPLYE